MNADEVVRAKPQTKSPVLCNFARGQSYSLRKRRHCGPPIPLSCSDLFCLLQHNPNGPSFQPSASHLLLTQEIGSFSPSSHSVTMADIPAISSLPKEASSYPKKNRREKFRQLWSKSLSRGPLCVGHARIAGGLLSVLAEIHRADMHVLLQTN